MAESIPGPTWVRLGAENAPKAPFNLGEEINGKHDETHPAIRMAGFHLLFNSDRDGNAFGLYNAKSKRVVRRYDYSKMPTSAWFGRNVGWLIAFLLSAVLLVYLYIRAFRKPTPVQEKPETVAQPPAV